MRRLCSVVSMFGFMAGCAGQQVVDVSSRVAGDEAPIVIIDGEGVNWTGTSRDRDRRSLKKVNEEIEAVFDEKMGEQDSFSGFLTYNLSFSTPTGHGCWMEVYYYPKSEKYEYELFRQNYSNPGLALRITRDVGDDYPAEVFVDSTRRWPVSEELLDVNVAMLETAFGRSRDLEQVYGTYFIGTAEYESKISMSDCNRLLSMVRDYVESVK